MCISKGHPRTEQLSWPPFSTGKWSSSSSFSHAQLSPSQGPVFITAGRPIVILPKEFRGNDFFSHETGISSPRGIKPQLDHTAPIIAPINDSPSVELMAARPISGAIESSAVSDVQQITTEPQDSKTNSENKEEESAPGLAENKEGESAPGLAENKEGESAPGLAENKEEGSAPGLAENKEEESAPGLAENKEKGSAPGLVSGQSKPSVVIEETSPPMDLAPAEPHEESIGPLLNAAVPPELTHCSTGDHLWLPLTKSSVRVSPLIKSCYEESKEQLVLDDSDSELEMSECSPKSGSSQRFKETIGRCSYGSTCSVEADNSVCNTTTGELTVLEELPTSCETASLKSTTVCEDAAPKSVIGHEPLPANGEYEVGAVCEPPLKRARVSDTSEEEDEGIPTCGDADKKAKNSQNSDTLDVTVDLNDSSSGQMVPDLPRPHSTEPTVASDNSAGLEILDHSMKLVYPHEVKEEASDGSDTVDQMLPTECAREHAMMPNFVRCANEGHQPDDDRDEPDEDEDDDGLGSAHLKALGRASSSQVGETQHASGTGSFVRGLTVVEEMQTDLQIPKVHQETAQSELSTISPDAHVSHTTSLDAVLAREESALLNAEHQIVPVESFNKNAPSSSSQSLYIDFPDKADKPYLASSGAMRLDDPTALEMQHKLINKKHYMYSDDQALPQSPPQLGNDQYHHHWSDSSESGGIDEVQRAAGHLRGYSDGQNVFSLGKKASHIQGKTCSNCNTLTLRDFSRSVLFYTDTKSAVSTGRLNLGRPHLRLGLSKRQQCKPLHKSK